jgi:hypothetical protein
MMMHPITGIKETAAEQLQSCEKTRKTKGLLGPIQLFNSLSFLAIGF